MKPNASRDPARVWTTIATGQPASVHGVTELETRRVAGVQGTVSGSGASVLSGSIRTATDLLRLTRPSIASGHERKVKTMWEVASDAGLRTVVVNWWATWPASSSRTQPWCSAIARSSPRSQRTFSMRRLRRLPSTSKSDTDGRLFESGRPCVHMRRRRLWIGVAQDTRCRARAVRGARCDPNRVDAGGRQPLVADLTAVYLPGLDIAQNTLLGRRDTALTPSEVAIASTRSANTTYFSTICSLTS